MRLSRQFQVCLLFFLTKRFLVHKNTSHLEAYARVKNCCLCCLALVYFCFVSWFLLVTCFCVREIFSSKKINRLEIVLITSLYYTTEVYPYQPTYRKFICTHFFLFVIICENLFFLWESFESLLIYDHLWESLLFMRIFLNLFLFMIICENLFFKPLWK